MAIKKRPPAKKRRAEKKESKEMKLVLVEWFDIIGKDSWQSLDKARSTSPMRFRSVGWLIRKDSKAVVVSSCHSTEDDTTGSVTSIPLGCICSVKTIPGHQMPTLPVSDSD